MHIWNGHGTAKTDKTYFGFLAFSFCIPGERVSCLWLASLCWDSLILPAVVCCYLQLVNELVDGRNDCPGEQSQNGAGLNVSTSWRHSHLIRDQGPLLLAHYVLKGSNELGGVLYDYVYGREKLTQWIATLNYRYWQALVRNTRIMANDLAASFRLLNLPQVEDSVSEESQVKLEVWLWRMQSRIGSKTHPVWSQT